MMISRRFHVVLLMAIVLISGCSSSSPSPSVSSPPAPSSTQVPGPASSWSSPAVSTATPPAVSSATPAPSQGPSDPILRQVVVTVSDGLRVRSEPRVSDDSIKYEPVLPLGTELRVLDGPVSASGYTWYKVAPVSFVGLEGPGYGWVAMAGMDGEPWIALTERPDPMIGFAKADCPPVPTDVQTLQRLPHGARLVCFSRVPITVRARIVPCYCSVMTLGNSIEPSWFDSGESPLLLVEPSETDPPSDSGDWLTFTLDPAGRHPSGRYVGDIVEVTGMFDHPDAASCLLHTWEFAIPVQSQGCRFDFAVTSLVAVRQ